jgi:hypothetical protein
VPFEIEHQYVTHFNDPRTIQQVNNILTVEPSETSVEQRARLRGAGHAWIMSNIFEATREILPEGWRSFHAIDEWTWLAVCESTTESGENRPYTVRYEVYPIGVYKLDYRTGERKSIDFDEAQLLFNTVCLYASRVMPRLKQIRVDMLDDEPEGA